MKDDTSRKPVMKSFLAVPSEPGEARKCWSLLGGLGKWPSLDGRAQVVSCALRGLRLAPSLPASPLSTRQGSCFGEEEADENPRHGRTLGPRFSVSTSHWASEDSKYSLGDESPFSFPSEAKVGTSARGALRAEPGPFSLKRGRA